MPQAAARHEINALDEAGVAALGAALSVFLNIGDLVVLKGDPGAGKTLLARGLVRSLLCNPAEEVASPSFPLVLHYEAGRLPLAHADFYRLEDPAEARELALDDALDIGAVLVEWPDKGVLPDRPSLTVEIGLAGPDRRDITLRTETPFWRAALPRVVASHAFLVAAGHADALRAPLQGDASTRRYERILPAGGPPLILMDAPRRADGPPVRDGKPYSRLAHLAEDVRPFLAVGQWLYDEGFAAPAIKALDIDEGLLLLEDLGAETVRDADGAPVLERYLAAAETLAALHERAQPHALPFPGGIHHAHAYDWPVLQIELELFADWFVPRFLGAPLNSAQRAAFLRAWHDVLAPFLPPQSTDDPVLVLRDFHSPNLIWRSDKAGVQRIGLLDFQDALLGHPAYDLASLAQDARVAMAQDMENAIFTAYCAARGLNEEERKRLIAAFAAFGAQRLTKVLGIFVRLAERDGKPGYLAHLPHCFAALSRNLAHKALAPVATWHEAVLPLSRLEEAISA